MKLSKEQKAMLAEKLSNPWGQVKLICDGYRITLNVERVKAMQYRVVTYVNGEWKGVWFSGREEHPEQKFLNKKTRYAYSPTFRAKMLKLVGKRAFAKDPDYSKTYVSYDISWASGKAAIAHLCRVCESVEIAPAEVTA